MNESLLRRLAYVKSLYGSSEIHFRRGSDIETSQALLLLDNGVESFFWIVVEFKAAEKLNSLRAKSSFNELIDAVSAIDSSARSENESLKEMHRARNNIQHNGILTARSQVDRYFAITHKLLDNMTTSLFGLSWKRVTLASLIRDPTLSQLYSDAESLFQEGRLVDSAEKLIVAFERAKGIRQGNLSGSGIMFRAWGAQPTEQDNERYKALYQFAVGIMGEIEVLKLGLDYKQWREYRNLIGDLNPFDLNSIGDLNASVKKIIESVDSARLEVWLRRNLPFVFQSILYWQDSETQG